jgi:hypothetical protein
MKSNRHLISPEMIAALQAIHQLPAQSINPALARPVEAA